MRFLQIRRRGQLGLGLGCGFRKRSKFFRRDVFGKIRRRYGRNLQPFFSGLAWFLPLLLVLFDDVAQIRFNRVINFGVVFFLSRFRFLRWEYDPFFPSSFFVRGAWAAGTIGMFDGRNCPREPTRLGGLGSMHDLVFKLGENAQQFAGFKWFDDKAFGAYSFCLLGLERFQLSYRQQDRGACSFGGFLEALAHLQAAVARHVNIQDDEIGFLLRDLFQRSRAVVDGDDLVARVRENFSPHVLGGHAVIGEQYLPSQRKFL